MKKMLIRILIIVVMMLSIIIIFNSNKLYASNDRPIIENDGEGDFSSTFAGDPTENPDFFNPFDGDGAGEETALKERAGIILGAINAIGVAVSVIGLVIIGIKYLLGSVEEKADYKKAMIPYIVGFILLIACTTIPNIIYKAIIPMNKL